MTSTTADVFFDTTKPIFILEVINVISEAAKAKISQLQNAFKLRAERMQAMMSNLAKLGKSRKSDKYSTSQSEAYGETLTAGEIAALLVPTQQSKLDAKDKGKGGSRSL